MRKATGINQHTTRATYLGASVGTWSEGCMVRRDWEKHQYFMLLVTADPRFKADASYLFLTTIIDATDFHRLVPPTLQAQKIG